MAKRRRDATAADPKRTRAAIQIVAIPPIHLEWTQWHAWPTLGLDRKDADCVHVPPEAGVYEVREPGAEARLTIGKGGDLRRRIRRQLVLGKGKHSTGKRMRASEDVSRLEVRWATTDRPCAIEEELHKQHVARFGRLPKYTKGT